VYSQLTRVRKRKKQPFLLKFYQFVRRLGVPHEETIGLPVLITLLALTQAQQSVISAPLEYTIIIAGLVSQARGWASRGAECVSSR
jgi:hypothetical protein